MTETTSTKLATFEEFEGLEALSLEDTEQVAGGWVFYGTQYSSDDKPLQHIKNFWSLGWNAAFQKGLEKGLVDTGHNPGWHWV